MITNVRYARPINQVQKVNNYFIECVVLRTNSKLSRLVAHIFI
jgi:hypothetical protein